MTVLLQFQGSVAFCVGKNKVDTAAKVSERDLLHFVFDYTVYYLGCDICVCNISYAA